MLAACRRYSDLRRLPGQAFTLCTQCSPRAPVEQRTVAFSACRFVRTLRSCCRPADRNIVYYTGPAQAQGFQLKGITALMNFRMTSAECLFAALREGERCFNANM